MLESEPVARHGGAAGGAVPHAGGATLWLDQQPPLAVIVLVAGEHFGVIGDQGPEQVFGLVGLLTHRYEVVTVPQVDPAHSHER